MVIKLNLPIFVSVQRRNKMEKYEFRVKQPAWIWITAAILMVCILMYTVKTGNYFLIIMWSVYYAFVLINNHRIYTITPDCFMVKSGLAKPRTFLLENITDIEKKYTEDHQLKSIVIKYVSGSMPHNSLRITKYDTNIDGILNAILDYRSSVPVH